MARNQPAGDDAISIRHDGKLVISTGKSRYETAWKNTETSWRDLLRKLSETYTTLETAEEYARMSKADQDKVKDIGGFVGGTLKGGRRKAEAVAYRQLVTLDADFAGPDLWDIAGIVLDGAAMAVYSTHKHSPAKPRLRLVLPLSRPVFPDEYEAIARRVAADIGIDLFDDSTYEPSRLMYWPSTSKGAEYVFRYQDGPWLDADAVLVRYEDWHDPSYWPESSRVKTERRKAADKQGDPLAKPGLIGAFCRAYTIEEAITVFLPDVYEPAATPGRWTYLAGSTAGGMVEYDDGRFVYSHHGTDPAGGRLLNAFDLVRLHKFGALDDAAEAGTPVNRMPSYKAMQELAGADEAVRIELGAQRLAEAADEFGEPVPETADRKWMAQLQYTDRGGLMSTINNAVLIIENDPRLKGRIRHNIFAHRPEVVADLPWKKLSGIAEFNVWQDSDDAALRHFMEKEWGITGANKIMDAVAVVLERCHYHPVLEYLEKLEWDGTPRVDTLLIDWIGAEDCAYVRAVTRKTLCAAVARVNKPGIKFDYMLVLTGPQGIGKSSLLMKLAGKWFSDSLTTVEGKEAYEHLQGYWILEMSELSATKRAEIEAIKLFISKQSDSFRAAYGRRTQEYPRQCIFIGTTNVSDFLRDQTGNRRYWPVQVGHVAPRHGRWAEMPQTCVDQIWAEAKVLWESGESLWLDDPEMAAEAMQRQQEVTEDNGKFGLIKEYLDRPIAANWYAMNLAERRNYISGIDFGLVDGEMQRNKVCVAEIFEECLGASIAKAKPVEVHEIHDIMRNIPGWRAAGKQRFGEQYGVQKAYVRV